MRDVLQLGSFGDHFRYCSVTGLTSMESVADCELKARKQKTGTRAQHKKVNTRTITI